MFDDEARGITFKQSILVFVRSRMRCRDDGLSSSTKTLSKLALKARTMFFEDMLEGLVRLSILIEALPMSAGSVEWPSVDDEGGLPRRLGALISFLIDDFIKAGGSIA